MELRSLRNPIVIRNLLGGLQQTNIRLRLHMDFIHNHTFIKLKNYRKVEERKKSG